jgi:large subunit ribosomal protein L6
MSRIGKSPVKIPSGVNVTIDQSVIKVDGPKGSLSQARASGVDIKDEDGLIVFTRKSNEPIERSNHGLMRSLVQNMVTGVNEGYQKSLIVTGVGFRVSLSGNQLNLSLGYSHPVTYIIPEGISAQAEQNKITVSGADKQKVGQVAAEIRALRKPEPYKGKGISYEGERIIRKSGKSGKEQA